MSNKKNHAGNAESETKDPGEYRVVPLDFLREIKGFGEDRINAVYAKYDIDAKLK